MGILKKNDIPCSQPGSNRRPSACKADVMTTTLWKLAYFLVNFVMRRDYATYGIHLLRCSKCICDVIYCALSMQW